MSDTPRLSARYFRIRPTVMAELMRSSEALVRAGRPVIDLSRGHLPGEVSRALRQVAMDSWRDAHIHYAAGPGIPGLRDAIVTWLDVRECRTAEDVVVAPGARAALSAVLAVVAGPGDVVLVDRAAWMVFHSAVSVSGATPVPCVCVAGGPRGAEPGRRLKLNASDVLAALELMPGARALLLANPVNPTAQVYSADELHAIIEVCAANRIFCIIDRLFGTLIYDGARFPYLQPEPAVRDWCILVDGIARAFRGLGGLKVGWACGPRDVIEAATAAQEALTGPAGRVEQRVALAALDSPYDLGLLDELQTARDSFVARMAAVPDLEVWPVAGTPYCLVDFRKFVGRTTPVGWILEGAGDIADFLLSEAGVLVMPGDSIGHPGMIRASFTAPHDEMVDAVARIERALSMLHPAR